MPTPSVTQAQIDAAKAQALRTGKPVPIIVGGQVVATARPDSRDRNKATVEATPGADPGFSSVFKAQKATAAAASAAAAKAAAAKAANAASAKKQQQAANSAAAKAANSQNVWLNGHKVKVTSVDQTKGTLTYTTDADGYQASTVYSVPTAYNALDNSNSMPSAGTQFLMSIGQKVDGNNQQVLSPLDQGNGIISRGTTGRNQMTVGNGLQWLANLSVKDPGSYTAMVDKLHAAGYLTDAAYATSGGGWNQYVGQAFAQAAQDVAVLNSTSDPKGQSTTLEDLLDTKGAANDAQKKKAQAANYTPVQRSYTDPTELAAYAKSAAEQALGRDLTPAELAKFQNHFKGLETQKYDQIDAAGRSGNSATVTDPSAAGQADAFTSTGANAQEAANWQTNTYGQALLKLFHGNAG